MAFRPALLAVAASLTLSSLALAQDVGRPAAPPSNPSAPASGDAPAATTSPTTAAATSTTTPTTPTTTKVPSGPAPTTGYAYGTSASHRDGAAPATPHSRSRARVHHASGPVATLPGFELLPEGGSRLFVQLTANVHVDEKPVAGGITYILKGAHVAKRNNENALVTVHFNTPVTRARLLPAGGDLHFVLEIRQNVKPTWKLVPAKDGATVLQIDFPQGDYLHDASTSDDDASATKPAAAKSDPPKK